MYCYIIQFEVDKTLYHRDTSEVSIALLTAASSTCMPRPYILFVRHHRYMTIYGGMHVQ